MCLAYFTSSVFVGIWNHIEEPTLQGHSLMAKVETMVVLGSRVSVRSDLLRLVCH